MMCTIESLLMQASNLETSGRLDRAIRLYNEALAKIEATVALPEVRVERQLEVLYRRAAAQRFHGHLEQAREDFHRCALLARQHDQVHWEARAQRALGEIFLRQKHIDVAVQAFERALQIAEEGGNPADALMTKARLARALCERGRMDEALTLGREIVAVLREGKVADRSARRAIMAQTHLSLGVAAFKKGQGRRARRFFQWALGYLAGQEAVLPLAECRRYLGILESESKNFLSASSTLAQALEVYTALSFDPGRFDCYLSLGITYMDMGDLHSARLCFQVAERIARRNDMQPELAKNQSRFADLEMREGRYEAARTLYEEDLRLTENTSDRQALAYCHRNVARACRALHDYRAGEHHARESRDLFQATGRPHLAALSQLELVECHLAQGRHEEAQRALNQAEGELSRRGSFRYEPRLEALWGKMLRACDDLEGAVLRFEKAIRGYLQQAPTRELAETRFETAMTCRRLGRQREAVEHLRNAAQLAERLGCRDIRERALLVLDEIDMVEGQRVKLSPYVPSGAIDELSANWMDIDRRKAPTVATVMFADMRDYTHLSGAVDESVLVETVQGFLSLVVRLVRHNNGTVDKFIGDCVMATFGLNQTPEQGARMALWTGLEILEQLAVLGHIRENAGVQPLHATIGINTGKVVSGCFGPLEKRDYTVVGYHVNLAARLQSLASALSCPEPNRLVVSDSTLSMAPHLVTAREIQPEEYALKGISRESVRAWHVTGRARFTP